MFQWGVPFLIAFGKKSSKRFRIRFWKVGTTHVAYILPSTTAVVGYEKVILHIMHFCRDLSNCSGKAVMPLPWNFWDFWANTELNDFFRSYSKSNFKDISKENEIDDSRTALVIWRHSQVFVNFSSFLKSNYFRLSEQMSRCLSILSVCTMLHFTRTLAWLGMISISTILKF